jgi:type III pantothenate kinase
MNMLLIDAGNSRIKWGVSESGAWLLRGSTEHAAGALEQAFAGLPQPHRILVSNVAGEDAARRIRSACCGWDSRIEFVSALAEQCGVRNGYQHPAQLGSDRWAALIAAWHHEHAACLVVNCGTATTVDALSADGVFLGGMILPGVDMMRLSLVTGTVQLDTASGVWREFPANTADAMHSGAICATVGAIKRQYQALGVDGAHCLVAGGAADDVWPHLDLPRLRMADMVLQGLQIIGQGR